jgi:hypothetical protein
MLDEKDLAAALGQIKAKVLHGPFSRCVAFHHLVSIPQVQGGVSRPQPLWGIGSKRFGGRFTPRNSFETIYLAEDPATALAEVTGVVRNIGGVLTLQSQPWVVATVQGILRCVLDLTDGNVVSQLGSNHQELTGEWRYTQEKTAEAPTQRAAGSTSSGGSTTQVRTYCRREFVRANCVCAKVKKDCSSFVTFAKVAAIRASS